VRPVTWRPQHVGAHTQEGLRGLKPGDHNMWELTFRKVNWGSTGDIIGRWNEYFKNLLNPTVTSSIEEADAESSEVDPS